MLRRPSEIVADCYRHASAAAERAGQSSSPDDQAFWLRCEQRWLHLAKHQEQSERLNDFVVSRATVSCYRIRETGDGLWEWSVVGNTPDIVFAGIAGSSVTARAEAFRFVADLDKARVS